MRTRLENYSRLASNVAIALVFLVIVGLLAQGYFRRWSRARAVQVAQEQALASIKGISLGSHQQTLVLGLNVDCGFCANSLPFYQRVIEATALNGRTQIIAVFPNRESEVADYVRSNKLTCQFVDNVDFERLGITGTPTLLLADKNGKIIGSWLGQLSSDKETDVLNAINATN